MPVVWSKTLDLFDRIQCLLGFVFVSLLLQWSEWGLERKTATVSFNKVELSCHLWMFCRCFVLEPLPAGRGGEGRGRLGDPSRASSRWWGVAVLQLGVKYMVACFAAMIPGRRGGRSLRWCFSAISTSWVEALTEDSRWSSASSLRQVVRPRRCENGRRWSLPCGGEDRRLDCVFVSVLRVLAVKFQDCSVFLHFKCPDCKMYPPSLF